MALSHGPPIITNGLVLCLDAADRNSYPGSGTTWTDLSGNGNNGTLVNGVGYNGSNRGSLSFDGVDDFGLTGNSGITGNNSWSISVWINVDISENGAGRQGWILWAGPFFQTNRLLALSVNGGKIEVSHWANDTIFSNSNITFGNFQNIVVTFDGSIQKIYINSINTDNKSTTLNIANNIWHIGAIPGPAEFLNCKISTFSVYNRALTASEVLQNYEATRSRFQ